MKVLDKEEFRALQKMLIEMEEKILNDPETIKMGEKLARELGTLSHEDLHRQMTI